jgi:molybdopterin/thiamine biosynthesis adenylyltransferase
MDSRPVLAAGRGLALERLLDGGIAQGTTAEGIPYVGELPGRFDRQLIMPGFGAERQRRLRAATVLVAGVGGLGGAAATYQAAGVGRLVLVHPGVLEVPDLNRQTLMHPGWLGAPRVECAARTLREHYPDVEVEAWDCGLRDARIPGFVARASVVVDARHNFAERYLLNSECVRAGKPLVVSAMNASEVYLLVTRPGTACLRCVFAEGDPAWDPLGFSVLGAVSGVAGCLAAMEAVKVAAGYGEPSAGKLVYLDLWDMTFRSFPAARDPRCPDCGVAVGRLVDELSDEMSDREAP